MIHRNLIFARQSDQCTFCGLGYKRRGDTLTIDHITPKSLGGKDEPDNLQALCKRCNNRKAALVSLSPFIIKTIATASQGDFRRALADYKGIPSKIHRSPILMEKVAESRTQKVTLYLPVEVTYSEEGEVLAAEVKPSGLKRIARMYESSAS